MKKFGLKFLSGVFALMLPACAGGKSQTDIARNISSGENVFNQNKQKAMITIQQGTVGKVGKFSVGVRNMTSDSVDLAIWNSDLPQAKRNDYNTTFTTESGEIIPIGNKFYRIGKIDKNMTGASGTVEIEKEVDVSEMKTGENNLAIPVRGILELHGFSIEVASVENADGKAVATVEIYSNDYPKADLMEKGKISVVKISKDEELTIGDKKHKISGVYSSKDKTRGVLEIAVSPTN